MISMLKPSARRTGQVGILAGQSWRFSTFVVIVGGLIAACSSSTGGDGGPEPGVADALEILTGPPATSPVRTVLNPAPVVQVVDGLGDPVAQAGITVAVVIQSGGGTLAGTASVATNASGQATFSNLSINGLVGNRTLRFTSSGLTGVTSGSVAMTAGPAATLVANSVTSQTTLVGQPVTAKPSVKVTDVDGNPVAGVAVTFAITSANGAMTGGAQVTNAAGVATVGSWTVDAVAGANTMTATSAGLTGSPITFTATGSSTVSNFTIDLVYLTAATPAQQAAFTAAKARWEQVITGDLADYVIPGTFNTQDCGANTSQTVSGTVEDLRIYVELDSIDGPSQILGAAGPCALRPSGSRLTYVGLMTFDTADLADLQTSGDLGDVILHEMGHVLGYGTLWEVIPGLWPTNFLNGSCPALNPTFIGAAAVNAYTTLNGGGGTSVPVEDTGSCSGPGNANGDGTRDSHWEETIFRSELMTGFISGTVRPLSATSIRSLEDLGYTVNLGAADAFNIATQPSLRDERNARVVHLKNDVLRLPIWITDPATGKRRAIRR